MGSSNGRGVGNDESEACLAVEAIRQNQDISMKNLPVRAVLFALVLVVVATPLRSADDPKAQPEPRPEPLITRIYDIQALFAGQPDFTFSNSDHSAGFVAPPNRGIMDSGYSGGGGGGGLFPGTQPVERAGPTHQEEVDDLLKTITETVRPTVGKIPAAAWVLSANAMARW